MTVGPAEAPLHIFNMPHSTYDDSSRVDQNISVHRLDPGESTMLLNQSIDSIRTKTIEQARKTLKNFQRAPGAPSIVATKDILIENNPYMDELNLK